MIWRNEAPNSSFGLCVGFLIREKETNIDLLDMVVRKTDEVREKVESGGILVEISEGVCSKVSVKIIDSMKDIKYRKKNLWTTGCQLSSL